MSGIANSGQSDVPLEPPILELKRVGQDWPVRLGPRRYARIAAAREVSFHVCQGETLGLVGESGCGKSTVAKAIVQAPRPTRGQVLLHGVDLTRQHGEQLRRSRRDIQMIFQDPYSSLDPRWSVADLVAEPLRINRIGTKAERNSRVEDLLHRVGLSLREFGDRRPRQLSGGQAQRVGIARALSLSPEVVICDEAVSSLDVSIQAQVLNLLERLQRELNLTYIFIAHDLAVVRHVSDQVVVMYRGKVCEIASNANLYANPSHPYTASLLAAAAGGSDSPRETEQFVDRAKEMLVPLDTTSGCPYRTRCPSAQDLCAREEPALRGESFRQVACHFPLSPVAAATERVDIP